MKLSVLIASACLGAARAAVPADKITSLPGYGAPKTNAYSGYLSIGAGKFLHYMVFASQGNPATDPVVAWYNGGPGCSSLEGAFQESGPYWTTSGGANLQVNEYSWNRFATQLFIEAPAGVGFSYADTPAGTHHNDTSTAVDNLASLKVFFAAYPEYASQPFWITGESYAGVYIPMLAFNIYQDNLKGGSINLKGILVGNGCIGNAVGICGSAGYADYLNIAQYHGHGFISDKAFNAANAACGDYSKEDAACRRAIGAAADEVGDNVDVYDVYSGIYGSCNYGARKGLQPVKNTRAPTRPVHKGSFTDLVGLGNSCTNDDDLTTYMTTPAVVAALHVKAPAGGWTECGGISYDSDMVDERFSIYPTLINDAKLDITIYNGEADACVPITDNQWWTSSMNLTAVKGWTPWMGSDGTLGGYLTQYEAPTAFNFITIRGAGHMVPQVQPPYAFDFVSAVITGKGLASLLA